MLRKERGEHFRSVLQGGRDCLQDQAFLSRFRESDSHFVLCLLQTGYKWKEIFSCQATKSSSNCSSSISSGNSFTHSSMNMEQYSMAVFIMMKSLLVL